MRYVDVRWLSLREEDPIRLVSELDQQGYEVRKLEFFRNGEVGFACAYAASVGTLLGEDPVPSIEEINADPQFIGGSIAVREFEVLWKRYASGGA